jgi:hypothetical protein
VLLSYFHILEAKVGHKFAFLEMYLNVIRTCNFIYEVKELLLLIIKIKHIHELNVLGFNWILSTKKIKYPLLAYFTMPSPKNESNFLGK